MTTVTKTIRQSSQPAQARPDWLDESIYPFESHFITVEGNRIHYIDEGAGPVILFVHGAVSWSFLYRDIIKELRRDFRCIAVDWPGFGLSEAVPDFETTLPGNSRLLETLINELGLRDITLFGHDSGASMALGVVGRQPAWFRGLIVANAFGFPLEGEFPDITRFLRLVRTRFFRFMIVNFDFLTLYTVRGCVEAAYYKPKSRGIAVPPARNRAAAIIMPFWRAFWMPTTIWSIWNSGC